MYVYGRQGPLAARAYTAMFLFKHSLYICIYVVCIFLCVFWSVFAFFCLFVFFLSKNFCVKPGADGQESVSLNP